MYPGGIAGAAHGSDFCTDGDGIPFFNIYSQHVGVHGIAAAVAVLDDNTVAVAVIAAFLTVIGCHCSGAWLAFGGDAGDSFFALGAAVFAAAIDISDSSCFGGVDGRAVASADVQAGMLGAGVFLGDGFAGGRPAVGLLCGGLCGCGTKKHCQDYGQ